MKRLLLLLVVAVAALAQSNYPAALDNDASLFITADNAQTTLSASVGAADVTWNVASSTGFAVNMLVTVCDTQVASGVMAGKCTAFEHARITAINGNALTVTRGVGGTSARSHVAGKAVSGLWDKAHHDALKAGLIAVQTALGPNLSNVAGVLSTRYIFAAQQPGGSLIAGANAITMTPVPAGVNGSDLNHPLYVSGGTGTAEACTISGGGGTAGQASGTIIITCANPHSGAWTIQSATAGMQEALQTLVTAGAGGKVTVPEGTYDIYAPVRVNGTGYYIQGAGKAATYVRMMDTGTNNAFEFISGSISHYNGLSDISIVGNNGTVPTLKSGGAAVKLTNQSNFIGKNLYIYAYPNGINSKDAGFVIDNVEVREPKPATGVGFLLDGGGAFDNLLGHFMVDASAAYHAGIRLVSVGYVAIDRADVINANYDLLIDPGNSQFVNTVDVVGSYFDTAYISGIHIAPTGTGMVTRVRFLDCWTASSRSWGVYISGTGSTTVDGISFVSHYSPFNVQNGWLIGGATVKNIEIRNSFAFGNSTAPSVAGTYDGIAVASGVTGLKITNTVSRRYADATDSQSRGLNIASGVSAITLIGNDFSENVNGALLDQSTSTAKIIHSNAGVDDQTPPTVASAATITLPDSDAPTVYITGTTALATINGGWKNRVVTLQFTDAAPGGVTTGGNIYTAKAAAQNATVTLRFDGTKWLVL